MASCFWSCFHPQISVSSRAICSSHPLFLSHKCCCLCSSKSSFIHPFLLSFSFHSSSKRPEAGAWVQPLTSLFIPFFSPPSPPSFHLSAHPFCQCHTFLVSPSAFTYLVVCFSILNERVDTQTDEFSPTSSACASPINLSRKLIQRITHSQD